MSHNSAQAIFCGHILDEVLKGITGIRARAMFGGYGIYRNSIIFAIIAFNKLYFKVDDINRPDYEKRGSVPFMYMQGTHKLTTMSYWEVPKEVMKDGEVLKQWVEAACQASVRSQKKKR